MNPRIKFEAWSLLIILTLIWGSSFILIHEGLRVFPPQIVSPLRLSIAFLCLVPFAIIYIKRVRKRDAGRFLMAGFFGNALPSLLFPAAQVMVSSAVAGIFNSLSPFWVLILGWIMFGRKFSGLRAMGVLIGLAGTVLLIIGGAKEMDFGDNAMGSLMLLGATFCYGLSTNIIRGLAMDYPPLVVTTFQLSCVGFPALIWLFAGTDFLKLMEHPGAWWSLGAIIILGSLGTALSVVLFTRLIQITDAVFSSSVTYLMPIVAVFWGLVTDEKIFWLQFVSMGVILAGVYLVNKGK